MDRSEFIQKWGIKGEMLSDLALYEAFILNGRVPKTGTLPTCPVCGGSPSVLTSDKKIIIACSVCGLNTGKTPNMQQSILVWASTFPRMRDRSIFTCPCCGKEPDVTKNLFDEYIIHCHCGIQTEGHEFREEAVRAWNGGSK